MNNSIVYIGYEGDEEPEEALKDHFKRHSALREEPAAIESDLEEGKQTELGSTSSILNSIWRVPLQVSTSSCTVCHRRITDTLQTANTS